MTAKKCIFCGATADLLCDSKLGWERMREQIRKEAPNLLIARSEFVPLKYRVVHTCDAPLCRACAVCDGIFHARGKGFAFSDSVDYCPGHDFGTLRREITGIEADAMRVAWKAKALASRGLKALSQSQPDMFVGNQGKARLEVVKPALEDA
jgi:hypothetical protein